MDNWKNLFIFLLSMSINIYSVYKTSRFCDVGSLNLLHNKGAPIWPLKIADIRVSKIPRGTMVNL